MSSEELRKINPGVEGRLLKKEEILEIFIREPILKDIFLSHYDFSAYIYYFGT